ncbi:MAG: UDP-2,3-diacylglucosamine diphosphatase LpxI [Acidobacteria bacterium]|nr:UDP-2,3-diacylglucosamine diphosphatase LpxI [Acidobacteriota bacterium]
MEYGLIAGNGKFPFLVIEGARKQGVPLAVVAIREETDPSIESVADTVAWFSIGQLGKLLLHCHQLGIKKAMMAGHVKHTQLFSGIPDLRMVKLLWSLPRRNTDALIGGIADEMAKEGIELIDSTFFLKENLAPEGVLTRRKPSRTEAENIEFGLRLANEIARLDIGQTICVGARACVAVEAMEGTDATIRRAGDMARGSITVVKVAKPNQDMRFDVPVIGLSTVETMIEAGATCLSITAGKTLIFDREEMLNLANNNKIAIVGSPHET